MFVYNTTPHTATGFTSFELVYRHQAPLPTALTSSSKSSYTYDDYAQELRERIRAANQIAKESVKKNKRQRNATLKRQRLLHDETVRRGRKNYAIWIRPLQGLSPLRGRQYTGFANPKYPSWCARERENAFWYM
ncbi:hypothetical protein P5V15_004256 [Pogonomyrmex californicus]